MRATRPIEPVYPARYAGGTMTCIVVKRGEFGHYDRLYRAFGDRVPVVWDRRRATRRAAGDGAENPQPRERRSSLPTSWEALGFVVTHNPMS